VRRTKASLCLASERELGFIEDIKVIEEYSDLDGREYADLTRNFDRT